jgi:hypothetical protein
MYYILQDSYVHCSQLKRIDEEMTAITGSKHIEDEDIEKIKVSKTKSLEMWLP